MDITAMDFISELVRQKFRKCVVYRCLVDSDVYTNQNDCQPILGIPYDDPQETNDATVAYHSSGHLKIVFYCSLA